MPDSFDMTALSPSRTAPRSRNQSFGEFTNSEEAKKKEREREKKRRAVWGREYERQRENSEREGRSLSKNSLSRAQLFSGFQLL